MHAYFSKKHNFFLCYLKKFRQTHAPTHMEFMTSNSIAVYQRIMSACCKKRKFNETIEVYTMQIAL